MLLAAALCLSAAVAFGVAGLWLLSRPRSADPARQVLRAVAPTQLAAAVMLTFAAVVALAAQHNTDQLVVIVCVAGAVATVAAGCWQSAKAFARGQSTPDCSGACATCTLSCQSASASSSVGAEGIAPRPSRVVRAQIAGSASIGPDRAQRAHRSSSVAAEVDRVGGQ